MLRTSRVGVVFVVVACLSAAGCGESYGKKLVGVWEGKPEGADAKKEMLDLKITMEFKADGGLKIALGPFESTGTYKVTKEDGKTVTLDTEVTSAATNKKETLTAVFEDADTVVISRAGDMPVKLKRKS
ncbi:MAG TPA: hypothetical protein VKE40_25020 [Gemmataceae bacterium]|nr:hypothetical protein [Gemmataceae bacterium]